MKSKKSKLFVIFILTVFSSSCVAVRPGQPYTQNTSSTVGRNEITNIQASKSLNNLYALLLAPTKDQISLLDLADNRVKLSMQTGRNPQVLAVSPNKSHILVVNQLDNTISTFFREDNYKIRDLGTIGSNGTPTDIIFNNSGTEAYVTNQSLGRITILEILNRDRPRIKKIISIKADENTNTLPTPFKVTVSSDDKTIYAIDKNNAKLYNFTKNNDDYVQNPTISLTGASRVIAEDIIIDKDKLYITDSNNSSLITVDTKQNNSVNTISLANQDFKDSLIPTKMAVNSTGGKLYVINQGSSTVAVIDINKLSLIKHIALSNKTVSDASEPSDISVSDNGTTIYVTNNVGRNLSIISGTEDRLLRNIGTTASSGALVPLSAVKIL